MLLEAHQLTKTYGRIQACTDICLSLEEGQVFGLLGPNGAGKTTLVKIFLGLVYASSGEAFIQGQPVGSCRARKNTGYLPELFRLYEWLSGFDYLRFSARLYSVPVRKERQAIDRSLEMVGLLGREKEKIRGYSKGMQQRLALAAALLHQPALIFLDEPTSALDPVGRRDIRDLIARLQSSGISLFLNSHLLSEAELTCTHLGFIKQGQLIATGSIKEFMQPGQSIRLEIEETTPEVLELLNSSGKLISYEGSTLTLQVENREEIPSLVAYLVQEGIRIYGVQEGSRGLEEVFIGFMQE
ncbi:MAG TPA: ABC transporter ATP-binding protein [Syntrophomonadaceae bacterium]|nr:ABC transporter ATP-binding protein [Syntrophomonadaceae bacterium]